MTNEQISKLVATAKRGFSDWRDVEDAASSATDMIQDLCTAIETLKKRVEWCKVQRDHYILLAPMSVHYKKQDTIDCFNQSSISSVQDLSLNSTHDSLAGQASHSSLTKSLIKLLGSLS